MLILTFLDVSSLIIFASSRSAVVLRIFKNLFEDAFCFRQGSGNIKTAAMLVLLLACFSSFQLIAAGKTKNASQPHIIFILADDLVSIAQL